jgi:urease accessory protein
MLIANKLLPRGQGLAPALVKRAASVELDWDLRQKSRFETVDSAGAALAVILPRGSVLRGGDVLLAEDGSPRRVIAAKQPVMVVTPCAEHGSPFDLTRAAYHLGNRHVALDLKPDRLQFEPDHVLADMLRAMHLTVTETEAPFEPEAGAYAAGGHGHEAQAHAHDHAHAGHDHAHGHGHAHAHAHAAEAPRGKPVSIAVKAAPAPHVHGPGCGHDH